MIQVKDGIFELTTEHTGYYFRILKTGHPEHLYYGRKLRLSHPAGCGADAITEKHAFAPGGTIAYSQEHPEMSLEDICLEMSAGGKGDVREPFLEVTHADGSTTSDFLYDSYRIPSGAEAGEEYDLPRSYDATGQAEYLVLVLKDKQYELTLELHYTIYPECDVITRYARLINESRETVHIDSMQSLQLDFATAPLVFTTFTGSWGREMKRTDTIVYDGKHVNASYTGTSSSRANPFVMLSDKSTTEDYGNCYGVNLIYSGNHYEAYEVSAYGKGRLVSGINPRGFGWKLEPGAYFTSPEAVMAFSKDGFNGMSQCMHAFVREHIVRGEWKKKVRPVLLNSWEAAYFDINEKRLLNLARAGKEVGIELFVMDDGWFGNRDDDTQSLGDWTVNTKKLPGGLKSLVDKVRALGLAFGIWVEPEMVNEKSKLYEEHPEWVLRIPEKPHSQGRNQMILDLSNREVQDYIIDSMKKVFSAADISYVKWDMNRIFSDVYSRNLPSDRQGELVHRYYLGLYRCMRELTESFPQILFEGCSSGGNRFDLGILSYFPQIWASDDTDALCRAEIQNGYSYGYPMSCVSAHVSACPNHQTLRVTPLETRFNVAAFGVFGYECNLCDCKREDLAAIKAQIALYKEWREVLQFGNFYRGRSFSGNSGDFHSCLRNSDGNVMEWTCVSEDQSRAVGMLLQRQVVPNAQFEYFQAKGLDPDAAYHFYNRLLKVNVKDFGDLVNTLSPVHIRQDSLLHELVARFVKLDGECEDVIACGDVLMYAGVKLKQAFAGTGYSEEVRHFQDFGSRLYFLEKL